MCNKSSFFNEHFSLIVVIINLINKSQKLYLNFQNTAGFLKTKPSFCGLPRKTFQQENSTLRAEDMAQMIQHLPTKCKTPSSNSVSPRKAKINKNPAFSTLCDT
jgi:hypothetical protein